MPCAQKSRTSRTPRSFSIRFLLVRVPLLCPPVADDCALTKPTCAAADPISKRRIILRAILIFMWFPLFGQRSSRFKLIRGDVGGEVERRSDATSHFRAL